MRIKILSFICLFLLTSNYLKAQVYEVDSLRIEIKYKDQFVVKEYKDLNIDIEYLSKAKKRGVPIYKYLDSYYRSNFGNCYFELRRYDSVFGYKNITFDIMGSVHPPKRFDNEQDILKYDPEKETLSSGTRKALTFNLLNFTPILRKGQYVLIFYLRTGNKYGYDGKRSIITNSVNYIESAVMRFEIVEDDIETPNKIGKN